MFVKINEKKKRRYKYCSKRIEDNKTNFIKRSMEIFGNKYDYSKINYTTMTNRVTLVCPVHGDFEILPSSHVLGTECLKCKNGETEEIRIKISESENFSKSKPRDWVNEKGITVETVSKYTNGEYTFTGRTERRWKGNTLLFELNHTSCGNNFFISKSSFRKGGNCSHCFLSKRKTLEEHQKDFDRVSDGSYTILEKKEPKNNKVPILVKHETCGNEYRVRPAYFLGNGNRCPRCNSVSSRSNPVKVLIGLLESRGIEFELEYRDSRCFRKLPLPFDFKIQKPCGGFFLLEYQGSQHFDPLARGYDRIVESDGIKKRFCEENDIPLFYINYNDPLLNSFEKILTENGLA